MSHFETITLPDPMDHEAIKKLEELFHQELLVFDNLLHQVVDVVGIELQTITSKASLAFLIERKKVDNPDNWVNDITTLKMGISKSNEATGKAGVSWLLSDEIFEAYSKFLDQKIAETDDKTMKTKLGLIKKLAEQNWDFNRKAQEAGKPISFGGVSKEFIPKWYYLHKNQTT